MNVKLISHTQLSTEFKKYLKGFSENEPDGKLLALTAIRTCYSPNKPSEIIKKEGQRYLKAKAADGKEGTDADRLIRMIVSSGHTSTLEGVSFNFAIEGVSRALLAQLTRHRVGFSFSVQSQRYVRFGSDDKSGGFGYVVPKSVSDKGKADIFIEAMSLAQSAYDRLRKVGVPAEDARMVLPQAATTNLVMTANLRALLDFYGKRRAGKGAQAEIAELAENLRKAVAEVEPWTDVFFERA